MSIAYRAMKAGEEDAVAAMIRLLPRDLGLDASPAVTGEALRLAADLVQVTVADQSGLLVGACVWMMTYSTWRATKGMYVCDLYVMGHMRGKKLGEHLLRGAARQAEKLGARYIKLEVSTKNPRPEAFYTKQHFTLNTADKLMFLENAQFSTFVMEK